jgi:outer membrane receptor protein involved in Fe transport
VDSDVFQRNLFLWVEQEFVFSPEWRVQIGMRGDYMTFDVDDRLDGAPDTVAFLPHASGYAAEGILSPKLNVVFSPWNSASLYANVGTGFHSNDARAVVIARRTGELQSSLRRQGLSEQEVAAELERRNLDPGAAGTRTLPRATGAELGLTAAPLPWLVVGAAAWWLRLEEELVYVGDEGTTEVSGRSARWGLDLEARVSLTEWLLADADVNLATGRFVDAPEGEDNIPLAPRVSSSGGLTARHPSGVEASLRYRFVGDRPANEANTVTALGSTVVDLGVAYRFGLWTAFANLENVLNTAWNEAQFDTFSRLKGEPAGVSELHYTPGNPRNLRAGIELSF